MTDTALMSGFDRDARRRFRREIVRFNHRLAETGLFTDEALARLLDAHPREALDVCTMSAPPPPDERWIAGEAAGLSGAELVEAAKRGRIWLNVRRAMNLHADYRAAFERLMGEFSAASGARVLSAMGGVLVSAPNCGVFYHCDATETMLWHVRGVKTMYLYPVDEAHLPEEAYEGHLLKENLSDLPYSPALEADVTPVTLNPGESVVWPLHAPHRVVNHDSFNVSVTIEFTTPHSMLTNGVYVTNGVLRRRFGLNPSARNKPAVVKPAYWAASKALRRLARKVDAPRKLERRFDVDLAAPDCIAWRPGLAPK